MKDNPLKPALILLPGMDGTGELFAPFVSALGGEFDVRIVRYPGDHCGGYDELEAIARAAIPEDRPYVLLGESFSGPIAISIAASAPGRIRGLVLCCTFARNPRPGLASIRALLGAIPLKALPAGWLVGPPMRSAFNAALAKVTTAALRARLRAVLSVDVRDRLADCPVPVLYLQAQRDFLVPRHAGHFIQEARASTTRIVAFDTSHFLLQSTPVEAAREVLAFCRHVATDDAAS
jgi:pimeloyl-[acyl-carrier protein] methyl ester esterase